MKFAATKWRRTLVVQNHQPIERSIDRFWTKDRPKCADTEGSILVRKWVNFVSETRCFQNRWSTKFIPISSVMLFRKCVAFKITEAQSSSLFRQKSCFVNVLLSKSLKHKVRPNFASIVVSGICCFQNQWSTKFVSISSISLLHIHCTFDAIGTNRRHAWID